MKQKSIAGLCYMLALILFGTWAVHVEYEGLKQRELTKLVLLMQKNQSELIGLVDSLEKRPYAKMVTPDPNEYLDDYIMVWENVGEPE